MADDSPQMSEEEMVQYVQDKIREGLDKAVMGRTKEDRQASRTKMLELYDDATAFHLEKAEKWGAEVGDMKMTAEFRFNKELGTWELETLQQRYPVDLPNMPIKSIRGVYTVDPKFWKGGKKEDDG